ncbi:S8 family serine peptidase [Pendulispora rubella]|uniref:S8 family serine peptidase n=1 Tax=Pendulispora rubella TaxID=2741070 RepID=A0ABZ2LIY7_9BACT
MKRLGLGVTVVSFVVGFAGCSSSSPSDSSDTSDTSATGQAILREGVAEAMVEGHAPTSVLVFLKGSADLTAPLAGFATRAERGAFVKTRLVDHAKASQSSLLDALAKEGAKVRPFHIVNAVLVNDASPRLLRKLATRSDVDRIMIDKPVPLKLVPNDEALQTEAVEAIGSNITATGANRVWTEFGIKGEGVVIGGQDTGVEWNHPALKSHYRGWNGTTADHRYSWHDAIHEGSGNPCGNPDLAAPCDDYGHGTHTIGSVVGDDGGGNQIGMAPGAKWIACRNMDAGVGTASRYIECSEWFLAPYPQGADPSTGDPSKAPDVINNSWGCPSSEGCHGEELIKVIRTLGSAGILFVASAGNAGSGCNTITDQPATIWDATLSVGSYNHRNGAISSFSSRGPATYPGQPASGHSGPDVAAPGASITSAVTGGGYGVMSGTSMAGPHVVGEVALLLSANPSLRGNIAEITNIVTSTAKPKTSTQNCGTSGSARPNNTWGYGIIDAYAAVKSVR